MIVGGDLIWEAHVFWCVVEAAFARGWRSFDRQEVLLL